MSDEKLSWAEKIEGMVDPHLYVSLDVYFRLKHEFGSFGGPQNSIEHAYTCAGGIPIHVEHSLPFMDDNGEPVDMFAMDHDKMKPKANRWEPSFAEISPRDYEPPMIHQ